MLTNNWSRGPRLKPADRMKGRQYAPRHSIRTGAGFHFKRGYRHGGMSRPPPVSGLGRASVRAHQSGRAHAPAALLRGKKEGRDCHRDSRRLVFPDTNALFLGEKPQHAVYSVRFRARELWGEQAPPARHCLHRSMRTIILPQPDLAPLAVEVLRFAADSTRRRRPDIRRTLAGDGVASPPAIRGGHFTGKNGRPPWRMT